MSHPRISMRRGNRKKPPQKYKNTFAFKHNKNSRLTKRIQQLDTKGGLCHRCAEILEWRKKYRKYKILKKPRNCCWCKGQGVVKMAYLKICWQCARERKACPKCLQVKELIPDEVYPLEISELEDMLKRSQTSERQKRMIRRRWQDGSLSDDQVREALRRLDAAKQNTRIEISIEQEVEEEDKKGHIGPNSEYYGPESDDSDHSDGDAKGNGSGNENENDNENESSNGPSSVDNSPSPVQQNPSISEGDDNKVVDAVVDTDEQQG